MAAPDPAAVLAVPRPPEAKDAVVVAFDPEQDLAVIATDHPDGGAPA